MAPAVPAGQAAGRLQRRSAQERRRAFVARAATNDWDAIVFTRGAFLALPVTNQTMATYMDSELTLVREQIQASRERAAATPTRGRSRSSRRR